MFFILCMNIFYGWVWGMFDRGVVCYWNGSMGGLGEMIFEV